MSRRLPIFALPGVVLMPGTLLPLHIFEARYRAMVADVLRDDRTIGMALMRPGWEEDGPNPEIFGVGGAGEIVEAEELPDGRYNIVLEGRFRYRILKEAATDPYRQARVEELASLPFSEPDAEARARRLATGLFEAIRPDLKLPPLPGEELSAERLASEIALRLRYGPAELQQLLELDSLPGRFAELFGRMREWRQRIRFLAPYRAAAADPGRN